MREYIIPNWHAIMIHAPLGLLSIGLALEIITLLWRRSSARVAGRWMLLIGAVMAVPALTTGIYAYHDVMLPTTDPRYEDFSNTWSDLMENTVTNRIPDATSAGDTRIKDIPVQQLLASETGQLLKQHIWLNSIGLGLIFVAVIGFIGCSDRWRRNLYLLFLIVLIAGEAAIVNGAHHGGLTVYQQAGMIKPLPPGKPEPQKYTPQEQIMRYLPPAQLHFTLAGWTVGLALISLALSIRAMTQTAGSGTTDDRWMHQEEGTEGSSSAAGYPSASDVESGIVDRDPLAFPPAPESVTSHERHTVLAVNSAAPAVTPAQAIVPAGRFWMLAALAALATAAAGLWLIHIWTWSDLIQELHAENRNMYHSILGASIVVLTLLLAIGARFFRRTKSVLAVLSLLLLIALGLQIYVGVLMTFDSPKGPSKNLVSPLRWNVASPK